ncbi:hypothetical protein [Sphingomonas sp.]|jgi:hypothetical protein|uniref:hypothetical protein n=1 Tax=Sphingomonas sp. TaxID=28214 RepID=UPI003561E811
MSSKAPYEVHFNDKVNLIEAENAHDVRAFVLRAVGFECKRASTAFVMAHMRSGGGVIDAQPVGQGDQE